MPQLPDLLPYLSLLLSVGIVVGGFFAVRNGRQVALAEFQRNTIDAMQQRLTLLEATQISLKKVNEEQQYKIDMITIGMKKRGIFITFDGDMLILTGPDKTESIIGKRRQAAKPEADED